MSLASETTRASQSAVQASRLQRVDTSGSSVASSASHQRIPTHDRAPPFGVSALLTEYPLGQIGAAQALPGSVFERMNAVFTDAERRGERKNLAAAFAEIAKRRALPAATVDLLIATLAEEENSWVHVQVIYALAHAAIDHPETIPVITAATEHARKEVRSAAEHALRIMEHKRTFGEREPLAMAHDRSQSIETRLAALRIIKSTRIDTAVYDDIIALATDDQTEIRVAALGLFHYLARSPGDEFDQRVLIPELIKSMSDADPKVREAAVGALSTISMHRRGYHRSDQALSAQLDASAEDAEPRVRVLALVVKMQSRADVDEIIKRGLEDADPYVRRNAVSWLSSERTRTSERQAFLEQALQDSDADVRAAAVQAQQTWQARKRSWPIELWQTWRAGEYGKVGLAILTTVTIAAPILVCIIFLLYFMARLLTYLYQRRWRVVVLIPVIAIWATASYGMFMLYFAAGHAGSLDAREIAVLAGALWGATAVYAGIGWGMHYAVRR